MLARVRDDINLFNSSLYNRQATYQFYQINQDYIDSHLWTLNISPGAEAIQTPQSNKFDSNCIILFSGCIPA